MKFSEKIMLHLCVIRKEKLHLKLKQFNFKLEQSYLNFLKILNV
jgi:hypothetical protein